MATTTNYGWTTPDDTALVKDGASAIRTLGSSIDTTTKNLNPSTTLGDIEYRSSTANVNTRLPLGTAGQVLKVNSGATAPEWSSDNAGMTNPMTTTGDTIYSSSGSTPARLAIGSTGNVLTVSGGVPTWAAPAGGGGYTLIAEQTASGSTGIDFTSIATTYKQLIVYWQGLYMGGDSDFEFRLNADTGSNYAYNAVDFTADLIANYAAARTSIGSGNDVYAIGRRVTSSTLENTSKGYLIINNSNSTSKLKFFELQTSCRDGGAPRNTSGFLKGIYNSTSAITQISLVRLSGTHTLTNATDTSIQLWGLS
jgi:hypothetical protein